MSFCFIYPKHKFENTSISIFIENIFLNVGCSTRVIRAFPCRSSILYTPGLMTLVTLNGPSNFGATFFTPSHFPFASNLHSAKSPTLKGLSLTLWF